MADDVKATDLSVLRRWGPGLLLAASGIIWGVRLEAKVTSLEEKHDTLTGDVQGLDKNMADLRTDVTKFQGAAETLKVMIESVKDGVVRIEKKLDDLQERDRRGGK